MKFAKYIMALLLNLAFLNTKAQLNVTGNDWIPTIDATAVSEAGTDYATDFSLESLVNQSEMDVTPLLSSLLPPLFGWSVQASITSVVDWHPDLELSVRRSGDGTGSAILGVLGGVLVSPSISGGETYQTLSVVPNTFFTGRAHYNDIPIQYKVSGMSVLIPTKTYTAEVLYTFIGL